MWQVLIHFIDVLIHNSTQAQAVKMKYCALLDLFILLTGRGRGSGW